MKSPAIAVVLIAAAGILAGCAYPEPDAGYDRPPAAQQVEYGVVEQIDLFRDGQSGPIDLGAILGGVAGGVIGHQIGGGRGNTVATIAGALGGAFVGNQIERAQASDRYRVTVRLDNGTRLTMTEVGEGELRVGDRVHIVNNRVYRN